ncbi:MAG: hypothetical protein NTX55_02685 [Candidatus Parcubacteria bacterium]|nr:hypothetical protein [Candidatus Parcubacteria bacterium]
MAISWTARKQITYFLIFAVIVLGAIYFVWKGATKPTCFDNKQNQGEEGIDCGGPCPKKCLGEVQNLIVLWTRFFETSPGKYDMAALVKNPNLFLSISSLKYTFEIRDKDNLPIINKDGETFITPGETFPIFETNVDVGSRTPGQAFIELWRPCFTTRIKTRKASA